MSSTSCRRMAATWQKLSLIWRGISTGTCNSAYLFRSALAKLVSKNLKNQGFSSACIGVMCSSTVPSFWLVLQVPLKYSSKSDLVLQKEELEKTEVLTENQLSFHQRPERRPVRMVYKTTKDPCHKAVDEFGGAFNSRVRINFLLSCRCSENSFV